ncbi:MAG: NADH-quinone oxidoreductase subunit A [Armatimonadota bacterium]|nr:NADH-quinone oxidoreductase subunit A [Armatimonadota bacterium]
MLKDFYPILVMTVMAIGFAVTMIWLSSIAGKKRPGTTKDSPYECGSIPVGTARIRFDVKFYLVSILFILFDLEVVFLWPWAVVYTSLQPRLFGLMEVAVFIGILLVGFVYAWKKGALEWQ